MAGSSPSERLSPHPFCGHAFGLALHSKFTLAGFPAPDTAPTGRPAVTLELTRQEAVLRAFAGGAEPIGWQRHPDGTPASADVLAHPDAGYLLLGQAAGDFHVSPAGDHVRCAPSQEPGWLWQRYLFGRVLPFAATLRGLEPLHASAVALDGAGLALMGSPGVGKTTIAAELLLRGGRLIADDVAVVDHAQRRPVLHPGPPLMSLRRGPRPLFSARELDELGERIGSGEESLRLAVPRADSALPFRLLYLLEPSQENAPRIEALPQPEPAALLAGTFNYALRDPPRLQRLLDAAAAVAAHVSQIRVAVPPGCDLRQLAAQLLDDARLRLGQHDAG